MKISVFCKQTLHLSKMFDGDTSCLEYLQVFRSVCFNGHVIEIHWKNTVLEVPNKNHSMEELP